MLWRALRGLDRTEGVRVLKTSSVYETDPWGETEQAPFLNLVALLSSSLEPAELLAEAKRIERELGRDPRHHWGPREIDVDLLLSEGLQVGIPDLVVPHPALMSRPFVLTPLAEIAPELRLPDGRLAGEVAGPGGGVRLWGPPPRL